ncbi:MAG: hypothetical protein IT332_01460 [Ardenticatenales bacterium]|nr:hypothetical protein [Ardenticatenales bacterium]
MTTSTLSAPRVSGWANMMDRLNNVWHERALQVYLFIVLAHWAEHLTQAVQVFVLGWPRPASRGFLGQFFPWLAKSETLHYGYAIVMLIGLFLLRPGFKGSSRTWWTISLAIQFWHHIEHLLLQAQYALHQNLFGSAVPTSILQWVLFQLGDKPHQFRVELHLFYNTVVFIPMVIAMYKHMYPSKAEYVAHPPTCSCTRKPAGLTSAA